MKYLSVVSQTLLAEFLAGPLWREVKDCLLDRYPERPDVKDPSHVAAAKGHQGGGWDMALETIEKLPLESEGGEPSLFARPAVSITED